MKLVWKLLSAGLALSAFALPGYADAPGKKLQPIYAPPAPKPAPVQSRTYTTPPTTTYVYKSTAPTQSDIRNQAEARRIVNTQQQQKVIYRQTVSQPHPAQTTYRHVTTQVPLCPTYSHNTQSTYTVRHAPAPTHCAVPAPQPRPVVHHAPQPQPHHPCPAHGQTNHSHHTCPVHAPQQQVVYAPIPVETCHGKIIERLSNTRDGRKQYSVCYSDLTHLPPQDFSWALLERMERAADKACDQSSSVLYSIRAERECREETLERSVYETNMPVVVDAYLIKTGKRQPKVRVGDPIYR